MVIYEMYFKEYFKKIDRRDFSKLITAQFKERPA